MIDLLAVVAHPDDAELLCGGALLRAADRGRRTAVLDLTAGELGSWGTPEQRSREGAAAARVLGLTERRNAGLPDGALENTIEARNVVAAHIRDLQPRTVIAHWPDARHPDHHAASVLTRDACFIAGLRNAPIEGAAFRPHKIVYCLSYAEGAPQPSFVVDISEQMERKLEAIFAFGSQFEGRTAMGDVVGAGDRPLRDQILAHHAHYGALIRRRYGEPYWTRETLLVDDIAGLEGGSY